MTASDYPIYFPYGATSAPYSLAHPHRGDDRCNILGTPVVVVGTQIGLVGATGKVFDAAGNQGTPGAAHLHLQEWHGDVANTRKPQNSFKGGTVVAATSSSDFGNYVTIQCADGWNDSYCHLSQINVKVGDKLGVDMIIPDQDNYYGRYSKSMSQIRGADINGRGFTREEFRKNFVGQDSFKMLESMSDNPEADRAHQWMKTGYIAIKDNWAKQIADRDKLIADIQKKVGLTDSLQKKVDELMAERQQDTDTGNSIIRFLGNLFKKG